MEIQKKTKINTMVVENLIFFALHLVDNKMKNLKKLHVIEIVNSIKKDTFFQFINFTVDIYLISQTFHKDIFYFLIATPTQCKYILKINSFYFQIISHFFLFNSKIVTRC